MKRKKKNLLKRERTVVDDDGVQIATPSEGSYEQDDDSNDYVSESEEQPEPAKKK
jgi:hypothetical protein